MGTTADKLNKILESKAAIKAAIEAKGVSDVGDVLAEYPDKIASISGGGGGKFVVPNGLRFAYSISLDPELFDTRKVIQMGYMLAYFNSPTITSLDLSSWDVSSAMYTNQMFLSCYTLESIIMPLFTEPKVVDMSAMFNGCSKLKTIDLSNFNTCKVKTMNSMFYNCSVLTDIDMSTSDLTSCTSMSSFGRCFKLVNLKLNDLGHNQSCTELSLTDCSALSKESVLFLFNNAFDRKAEGFVKSFTIKLNATTKALLTDDEIAIATNKGFTVV